MWFKTQGSQVLTFSGCTVKNRPSQYFPFLHTETALVLGGVASEIPLGAGGKGKSHTEISQLQSTANNAVGVIYIYLENHKARPRRKNVLKRQRESIKLPA
jgi:hypothetical protein